MVFIDGANASGAGNTASVADYVSYGPNNELYLEPGNAIAFELKKTDNAASVQMAFKTVGGTGTIRISYVETDKDGNIVRDEDGKPVLKTFLEEKISTATDMYYDILPLYGKTVVIENAGSTTDAIVSITNVKVTHNATPHNGNPTAEPAAAFTVSRTVADAVLLSMNGVEEPEVIEPDVTEPEVTEPEVTEPEVTEPETTVPEVETVVVKVVKIIKKLFGKIFG